MAISSEDTPFLAYDEHTESYDETESHFVKGLPANFHFKLPLRVLTLFTSILSLILLGLLIASYVMVELGSFSGHTWGTKETIRGLAICVFVNTILLVPTIFLPIPIFINMVSNLAMLIVVFIFTGEVLGEGWPDSDFCPSGEWDSTPGKGQYWKPHLVDPECVKGRTDLRLLMGVSAGVSVISGLLLITTFMLRLVAVTKTRFWEGKQFPRLGNYKDWGSKWNPKGFTIQFTLSVLPHELPTVAVQRTIPTSIKPSVPTTESTPTCETSEELIDTTA